MLKDISIGQYFPGNSVIHRIDPRAKILLVLSFIASIFFVQNFYGFIIVIGFLLLVIGISKLSYKIVLRSLKPILPLIIFTSILNIFFIDGNIIFQWWIFKITDTGITQAIFMSIRIFCLIIGSSLLTYTTSPIALTDAIERLLKPLKVVKFPVHEMAMMMTIALRFIPTLIEETDKIMSAQKSRGADIDTGGLVKRAKALVPILIPLFVCAFRRAEDLALAMECRCYRGGEGRTRMKQLKLSYLDFYAGVVILVFLSGIILINIYFGSYLSI